MTDNPLELVRLCQIQNAAEGLGTREQRVLLDVARRLLMGQGAYGELHAGKKKWCREALEEAMDGMVYLGAALQDLADEEGK